MSCSMTDQWWTRISDEIYLVYAPQQTKEKRSYDKILQSLVITETCDGLFHIYSYSPMMMWLLLIHMNDMMTMVLILRLLVSYTFSVSWMMFICANYATRNFSLLTIRTRTLYELVVWIDVLYIKLFYCVRHNTVQIYIPLHSLLVVLMEYCNGSIN